MTKAVHGLGAILIVLTSSAVLADPCRRTDEPGGRKAVACTQSERLRPYEPDRERAGREPGFVDLGNGTEVRVGGRVQMDQELRR